MNLSPGFRRALAWTLVSGAISLIWTYWQSGSPATVAVASVCPCAPRWPGPRPTSANAAWASTSMTTSALSAAMGPATGAAGFIDPFKRPVMRATQEGPLG